MQNCRRPRFEPAATWHMLFRSWLQQCRSPSPGNTVIHVGNDQIEYRLTLSHKGQFRTLESENVHVFKVCHCVQATLQRLPEATTCLPVWNGSPAWGLLLCVCVCVSPKRNSRVSRVVGAEGSSVDVQYYLMEWVDHPSPYWPLVLSSKSAVVLPFSRSFLFGLLGHPQKSMKFEQRLRQSMFTVVVLLQNLIDWLVCEVLNNTVKFATFFNNALIVIHTEVHWVRG